MFPALEIAGIDYLARNKEAKSAIQVYNLVIQFFIETFVGMALGYFIGRYLDSLWFQDREILMYVLMFLGIFSGFVNLIRRALKMVDGGKDNEEK